MGKSITVQTSDTEKRLVIYGPTGNKIVDKDTKEPFGFQGGKDDDSEQHA